jgi:hypothetical protein
MAQAVLAKRDRPAAADCIAGAVAARGALFGDAEADTIYRGNPAAAIKQRNLRSE